MAQANCTKVELEELLRSIDITGKTSLKTGSWAHVGSDSVALPLRARDIPHFGFWINFNRFAPDHEGLDFSVYRNTFGETIIGLPFSTPVYAIADGVIAKNFRVKVMEDVVDPYDHDKDALYVVHGEDSGTRRRLVAGYVHVTPLVKEGEFVRKGQKIGSFYYYQSSKTLNFGRLTHLHLGLWSLGEELFAEDPELVFPGLMKLITVPQRDYPFTILEESEQPHLRVANFTRLMHAKKAYGFEGIREDFEALSL
ncbi:MAG: hypothetical protein QT08_C0018G0007 [archaeon GW2011_AR17]|nr:MAG: hypothetical protein QT08_C0018G0007 [archaeon GW2011_AR17]